MADSCQNLTYVRGSVGPATSTLMFLAGVVGNGLALCILGARRRARPSAFAVLVTGLAGTDLLGTCFLSPAVFVAYGRNSSLLGLARGGPALCNAFAFAMTFFGLASTLILCAMAVERCLALSHPYLYAQLDGPRCARLALPTIYAFCALFCALPLLGLGRHQQYCPGSWCFIRMRSTEPGGCAFSLAYASLMALLVAAIFICNGSVTLSLCRMHRQQRRHLGSLVPGPRKSEDEVDYLILLALITGVMAVCSLPLTVRGFTQAIAPDSSEMGDLLAFRFTAFNPILDPWVFILFRKAVFQRLRLWLCCLAPPDPRRNLQTPLAPLNSQKKDSRCLPSLGGKEGSWTTPAAWSGAAQQALLFSAKFREGSHLALVPHSEELQQAYLPIGLGSPSLQLVWTKPSVEARSCPCPRWVGPSRRELAPAGHNGDEAKSEELEEATAAERPQGSTPSTSWQRANRRCFQRGLAKGLGAAHAISPVEAAPQPLRPLALSPSWITSTLLPRSPLLCAPGGPRLAPPGWQGLVGFAHDTQGGAMRQRRACSSAWARATLSLRSWDRAGSHPSTQKMTHEREQTKTEESPPPRAAGGGRKLP
ncbi:PREDICTED: prostacyclin receptor [Elephantulus edwardii]|uniref:prostacyclin receptor n=1 Tax=Elephantulus edwardii TaxID=28737 RepID=UPI0003F0C05F|nr:PREDICTED: prostacyclin receptor [Elephantulus edwardii]